MSVEKIKQETKTAEEIEKEMLATWKDDGCKKKKLEKWVPEKVVLKILDDEAEKYPSLTVALAERVHIQWAGWTSYMLANMTPENIQRWKRQVKTRYEKLSPKEKETDYALAQQFIPIILRYSQLVEKQKLKELADLLKNRPIGGKSSRTEIWFEVFEKKFGEMEKEEK